MKYIITESQFNTFFKRRLGRIDGIINDTFTQLFRMYKCKENNLLFDPFWNMVIDDVNERAWDSAHMNREASEWEDGKYEEMLAKYLNFKKEEYKIKYHNLCKKD